MTNEKDEDVKEKIVKLAREGVPAERISQTMYLPLYYVKEIIDGDRFSERADEDSENIKNS